MSFKTFIKPNIIPQYKHNPDHFSLIRYMEDENYQEYFDKTDFSHYYNNLNRNELFQQKFYSAEGKPHEGKPHQNTTVQFDPRLQHKIDELGTDQKQLKQFITDHKAETGFVAMLERNTVFKVARNIFCVDYVEKSKKQKKGKIAQTAIDHFIKNLKLKEFNTKNHSNITKKQAKNMLTVQNIKNNLGKIKTMANNHNGGRKQPSGEYYSDKSANDYKAKVTAYFTKISYGSYKCAKKDKKTLNEIIKILRGDEYNTELNAFKNNPRGIQEGLKYAHGILNKSLNLLKTNKWKKAGHAVIKAKRETHSKGLFMDEEQDNFVAAEGLSSFRKRMWNSCDNNCGFFMRLAHKFLSILTGLFQLALTCLAFMGFGFVCMACFVAEVGTAGQTSIGFEMMRGYIRLANSVIFGEDDE